MIDDAPDVMRYRVDRDDRLVMVDEAWDRFAAENGSPELTGEAILGSELWTHLVDPATRQLYQAVLFRARTSSLPVRFRFRCDAPALRRVLTMEVQGGDDGAVEFATTVVSTTPREPVTLLDPSGPRSERMVVLCGWCKRARLGGGRWIEIEGAIEELGLFDDPLPPELSHGICPDCLQALTGMLDDPEGGPVALGA